MDWSKKKGSLLMYVDFYMQFNKEKGCFDFKSRCGMHLTLQDAQKIIEGLNIIISPQMEVEYLEGFSELEKEKVELEVSVQLSLKKTGWRIVEINAGEYANNQAVSYREQVILKRLLEQHFKGIYDEGLSIQKDNAELSYERSRPSPEVVQRPFNHKKRAWSFTCSTCNCKVESVKNESWWAASLYHDKGCAKYCSEACATAGLEVRIAKAKEWHFKRILQSQAS